MIPTKSVFGTMYICGKKYICVRKVACIRVHHNDLKGVRSLPTRQRGGLWSNAQTPLILKGGQC